MHGVLRYARKWTRSILAEQVFEANIFICQVHVSVPRQLLYFPPHICLPSSPLLSVWVPEAAVGYKPTNSTHKHAFTLKQEPFRSCCRSIWGESTAYSALFDKLRRTSVHSLHQSISAVGAHVSLALKCIIFLVGFLFLTLFSIINATCL